MRMRRSSAWRGKASSNFLAELAERIRQTGSGLGARDRACGRKLVRDQGLHDALARAAGVATPPPRAILFPGGWLMLDRRGEGATTLTGPVALPVWGGAGIG